MKKILTPVAIALATTLASTPAWSLVSTTPYLDSSVSGVAYQGNIGPSYIDAYAWVGDSYVKQPIEFGTQWGGYGTTTGVQNASVTDNTPVSISALNGLVSSSASSFAQSDFGSNKASLSTHSTSTADATADASSEWGKPLSIAFATPPNDWVMGSITVGVKGNLNLTGDSQASWNYRFEFNPASTPNGSDDVYWGSLLTVGGGADVPIIIPQLGPNGLVQPGQSLSAGTFTFANQGAIANTDLEFTLPIRLYPGVAMLSGSLVLHGESPRDYLGSQTGPNGSSFDLDGNETLEFVPINQAIVVEAAAEGDVNLDFAHTAVIKSITLPTGVTVSTLDGSAIPFAVLTAPVPEPETYALMLAGLGLVGFAARRRLL